jgi:hypothetical protein
VLPADDVIDLMGRKGISFVEQAVFTTPGCAAGDEQTDGGGDFVAHDTFRIEDGLALSPLP